MSCKEYLRLIFPIKNQPFKLILLTEPIPDKKKLKGAKYVRGCVQSSKA